MDEIVRRAMAKWPHVPNVYGWLRLDRRGNWAIKGERLANSAIAAFIGRNYGAEESGRWFFQNGPLRVFVSLAYTPLVYRISSASASQPKFQTHTGVEASEPRGAWLDETGALLLQTELGVGLIQDQDLPHLLGYWMTQDGRALADSEIEFILHARPTPTAAWLGLGALRVPIGMIRSTEVAARFGFDPDPRPAPGEPEC